MDSNESTQVLAKAILEQYGAALKMLEKLVNQCPDDYWNYTSSSPPFYKVVHHTLFFLDFYLSSTKEERSSFTPRFPEQEDYRTSEKNFEETSVDPLTKGDVLLYLEEVRGKIKERFRNVTSLDLIEESVFEWHGSSVMSSVLYNLRHVMLHVGALGTRLRQKGMEDGYWVSQDKRLE